MIVSKDNNSCEHLSSMCLVVLSRRRLPTTLLLRITGLPIQPLWYLKAAFERCLYFMVDEWENWDKLHPIHQLNEWDYNTILIKAGAKNGDHITRRNFSRLGPRR